MLPLDLAPFTKETASNNDAAMASRKVGAIVADDYRRARVMKQFGIEFCCGGGIPLEEACRRQGVSVDEVTSALQELEQGPAGVTSQAARWSNDLLIHYIEETHHGYVRGAIPSLIQFTAKVARVHGAAVPELVEIAETFEAMASEMEAHMSFEEDVLFPAIRTNPDNVSAFLDQAEEEHEAVGDAMRRIRTLSNDFSPPDWACATYRAAFTLLEEFETDLHAHVHLENNVLFPRMTPQVQSDS